MTYWPLVAAIAERLIAIGVSSHAVLKKRETRAAIGWVGLIWLTPIIGSMLYLCFGVNRLQRRGGQLQKELEQVLMQVRPRIPQHSQELLNSVKHQFPRFGQMHDLVGQLTGHPLLPGNRVDPLQGGDIAFPAMLAAIQQAQQSISLQSYIFDDDRAGREFISALKAAQQRGVEVRVLIDGVGARYSWRSAVRIMRREGLNCRAFLPTIRPASTFYSNLRNHRKLMVIDGRVGFAGGMNIREGLRLEWNPPHPVQDLHFRFEGPVTLHLQEVFAMDWCFAATEILSGERWFPKPVKVGETWCRGIQDGPDEDFEKLKMTILGAVSLAQKMIVIVTPYFLPDDSIIAALNVAVMRGVRVCILIPEVNNIRLVQWAAQALLPQILERGCEVFLTPPPFDHSKLLLVDGEWSLIGSTNWDARSLRLNFEFNVECYGAELNQAMVDIANQKLLSARPITLQEIQSRALWMRLRDGIARLASPYI